MGLNDQSKIGLGNRFVVKVDAPSMWELGSWSKADGLDVSWEVPDYRMGDGWNARLFAPASTKYTAVKLTRAASKDESEKVRQWLNKNATKHDRGGLMTISLRDSDNEEVLLWELRSFVIKKWAITSMDAGSSTIAVETLEVDHEGFLDDQMK